MDVFLIVPLLQLQIIVKQIKLILNLKIIFFFINFKSFGMMLHLFANCVLFIHQH